MASAAASATSVGMTVEARADASRAGKKEDWRIERNGSRNGAKHGRAKTTNWYHPFLWTHIEKLAPRVDWSAGQIEKILLRDHPDLFAGINRGTVWKWFAKDPTTNTVLRKWSNATLENVARGHAILGSGQQGFLHDVPEIADEAVATLKGMRISGLSISVTVARSIMLAIIQEKRPEKLQKFKCSDVS